MVWFWLLAALMLAVALAIVLRPLLRGTSADAPLRARREALRQAQRTGALSEKEVRAKLAELDKEAPVQAASPPSRMPAVLLALLLPVAAIALYRTLGEPRALDPVWRDAAAVASAAAGGPGVPADADGAPAPDMEQAVAGLAERLKQQPDDLEGWMLLGRAYKTMERFGPAKEALANAFRLAPENADVMVEYAEAQVLASETRRFEGEAHDLLQRALQLQPESQRGLWLLGIAAYQREEFSDAAAAWERLLATLPADAEPRASLQERIADARQRAGLEPLAPAASAAVPPAAAGAGAGGTAGSGPRLTVAVDVAPELESRIGASDVLFVYARPAQGPSMPLAIRRLPAASLPVTVTLDDSTSMMPAMKLSTIPQVVVGARISKSGQATPQPGDFETLSAPIPNTHAEPLRLTIDSVVPAAGPSGR